MLEWYHQELDNSWHIYTLCWHKTWNVSWNLSFNYLVIIYTCVKHILLLLFHAYVSGLRDTIFETLPIILGVELKCRNRTEIERSRVVATGRVETITFAEHPRLSAMHNSRCVQISFCATRIFACEWGNTCARRRRKARRKRLFFRSNCTKLNSRARACNCESGICGCMYRNRYAGAWPLRWPVLSPGSVFASSTRLVPPIPRSPRIRPRWSPT